MRIGWTTTAAVHKSFEQRRQRKKDRERKRKKEGKKERERERERERKKERERKRKIEKEQVKDLNRRFRARKCQTPSFDVDESARLEDGPIDRKQSKQFINKGMFRERDIDQRMCRQTLTAYCIFPRIP